MDEKYKIRACLLYDFKLGKTAVDSHLSLCKAFGKSILSERQCQRWFERFESGDESLKDEEHDRRPVSIDDEVLANMIEDDPTLTAEILSREFQCDARTVTNHLHAIGKSYRCGKWTPHLLTASHKASRVITCSILLRMSKRSGFWDSILTADETWILMNNSTRKRQWLSPNQPPIPTPKPDIHGKKVMLSCWWNSQGLVWFELIEHGKTVNAARYVSQLPHVNEALRKRGINSSSVRYLQDNAKPHTAKITQEKIEELGWELLPHAPYSPDLAPSDYHLFRLMKHTLSEESFKDVAAVEKWVRSYFRSKPREFFADGIRALKEKWRTVIDNNGEYILE